MSRALYTNLLPYREHISAHRQTHASEISDKEEKHGRSVWMVGITMHSCLDMKGRNVVKGEDCKSLAFFIAILLRTQTRQDLKQDL